MGKIHHCRRCGKSFCNNCIKDNDNVTERGWGNKMVKVCEDCYGKQLPPDPDFDTSDVTYRAISEAVTDTVSNIVNYPLEIIKDTVRPQNWIPDDQLKECGSCKTLFGWYTRKHHCRRCGGGFCDSCSKNRILLRKSEWKDPVRVCDKCYEEETYLDGDN